MSFLLEGVCIIKKFIRQKNASNKNSTLWVQCWYSKNLTYSWLSYIGQKKWQSNFHIEKTFCIQSSRGQVRSLLLRYSKGMYIWFQNHVFIAPEAQSGSCLLGKAEVSILNFKTVIHCFMNSPVSVLSPKQCCALAHLGCPNDAGTSLKKTKSVLIFLQRGLLLARIA